MPSGGARGAVGEAAYVGLAAYVGATVYVGAVVWVGLAMYVGAVVYTAVVSPGGVPGAYEGAIVVTCGRAPLATAVTTTLGRGPANVGYGGMLAPAGSTNTVISKG